MINFCNGFITNWKKCIDDIISINMLSTHIQYFVVTSVPQVHEAMDTVSVSLRLREGRGRVCLLVRPRLRGQRVPGSKSDSTEDPPYMEPVAR
ncbi:hypothetical protein AVEN_268549-1 [Araneus ventricosus]|uniref:Uncharacterized protein n=1 Tax=Araneus ventricosus TaxID=182803 RepID=A0A4Y2MND0_ARAVE|nr:hypothetical protein AVEN_268549-1 [Araneus ventricosus]